MAELTGSEILAKCLKKEGIEDIFYIMGGPMLLAEATCITEGIRMIDVRHEQAAAFACQAYSRLKQMPSVCMAASGPGVTNLITGMAQRAGRLLPGRRVRRIQPDQPVRPPGVPGDRPGRADARLLQARRSRAQPEAHPAAGELRAAEGDHRQAGSGLCRYAGRHPVPEDRREPGGLELRRSPIMDSRPLGDPRQVDALVKALAEAKQPLIVSGSGVIWSRAWTEMQAVRRGRRHPVLHHPAGPRRGAGRSSVLVPDDAQHGVRGCRPDHRARHADELHHRPRRAAALRRQREDRAHRHRSRPRSRPPRAMSTSPSSATARWCCSSCWTASRAR